MSFAWDAKMKTSSPAAMDLLVQMATFARVVETGSLSAAGRRENLSPAAVSRQIGDLEAQLGVALTLRTTRQLTVTEAGRAYYERVVRILRDVEDAADAVGAGTGKQARGLLTVSAPVTFGSVCLWPHLPALTKRHPRLRIDLRLEDHAVDLVSAGVDVAIRAGFSAPDSPGLVAHLLGSWERWVVASPDYLERHGEPTSPQQIADHTTLLHLPGGPWRFRRGSEAVSVQPVGTLRTNALVAVRDAVVAGHGLGVLPEWLAKHELAEGKLRRLLVDWTLPTVSVCALHRVELRGAARVRAFVDHLRRVPLVAPAPKATRARR
jgi:DNA-binding transcriptional LysR family regulator